MKLRILNASLLVLLTGCAAVGEPAGSNFVPEGAMLSSDGSGYTTVDGDYVSFDGYTNAEGQFVPGGAYQADGGYVDQEGVFTPFPSSPIAGSGGNLGTGGLSSTGGATSPPQTPASGGTTNTNPPTTSPTDLGFWTSTPLQGFVWTDVQLGTLTATGAGTGPYCVSGSLDGDAAYQSTAMLGFNLNQTEESPVLGTISTADSDGINLVVSNPGGSPLRIQIQGAAGYPSQAWCADVSGTGGFIAWTDFKKECWEGGAQIPYDQSIDIEAAILQVPGDLTTRSYNFCVTDLSLSNSNGGGTGGTGGTGGSTSTGTPAVANSGYIDMGNWGGYAWTDPVNATISPENFSSAGALPYCVTGSVNGGSYDNLAMLGVNLNQAEAAEGGAPTDVLEILPTGTGVVINITNNGTSPVRLQLQAADGDTNPAHRWCAELSGGAQTLLWSDFNTECWTLVSGSDYDGTVALTSAALVIPGDQSAAVPFDVCLNDLYQSGSSDTGGGTGGNTNNSSGTSDVTVNNCQKFYDKAVTIDNTGYRVKTNAWAASDNEQCLDIGGSTVFTVTKQTAYSSSSVKTYPAVYRGYNYGSESAGHGMPRQVSGINSILTGFHTNSSSISGQFNSTYDVYFSNSANGVTGAPNTYLMVWLDHQGKFNPISNSYSSCGGNTSSISGIDSCTSFKNVVIEGAGTFDVFVGSNGGAAVISFLRTVTTDNLDFDLMNFVNFSVGNSLLSNSSYLYSIQAGFEIMNGGQGLQAQKFYADVN